MPRFYFDIREGTRFFEDKEGLEFPDLDAAECEAALTAATIGRDLLPSGTVRAVTVEVWNEHCQRVLTVMVSMEVQRAYPPPPTSSG